jgi:hypothetical protein
MTWTTPAGRLRSGWLIALAVLAALFSFLTVIPIMPWQARCYEEPVQGPYRPIFLKEVSSWLSRQDVYHWRIGDTIFLRIFPLFDGNKYFDHRDAILNIRGLMEDLERDITIDGVLYPKPPALIRVEQEQQASGRHDGLARCRAAIQLSPADPPVP